MRRIRHENTQPAKSGLLRKEVKRVASTPTQGETISPLPSKELEESSLRYCLLYGTEAVYYEAFNLRALGLSSRFDYPSFGEAKASTNIVYPPRLARLYSESTFLFNQPILGGKTPHIL